MKIKYLMALACVGLIAAGCASNRGGTYDDTYGTSYDAWGGPDYPHGAASPSFRPGLNREDPRDAQFPNRPELEHSTPSAVP